MARAISSSCWTETSKSAPSWTGRLAARPAPMTRTDRASLTAPKRGSPGITSKGASMIDKGTHVIIIESEQIAASPLVYVARDCTPDEAVQRVHADLKLNFPHLWSDDWHDLSDDITEYG